MGERTTQTSLVAERDWSLWLDWCAATGRDPHDLDGPALAAFLRELPATTLVQDRRVRTIRRVLEGTGRGLPRPTTRIPTRIGPPWLTYTDALTGLRHEWFPEGVAARRDALILVLAAHGFTRTRIRRLQVAQVEPFPTFVIDGLALTQHRDPALCARCALTRWLAVLDAYRHRSGRDIEDLLTQARAFVRPQHDCLDDLNDGWRTSPWLVPAIDKHASIAPNTHPITGRALTSILTRRFTPGPPQPISEIPEETSAREQGRRPTHEEQDEIASLYDRIDTGADALNTRIQRLLDGLK